MWLMFFSLMGGAFEAVAVSTPQAHLLAHYGLNEGSGSVVVDQSGHGNDAVAYNDPARLSSGILGGAYGFNGGDEYVEVVNEAVDPDNDLTISFWISFPAITPQEGIMGEGEWDWYIRLWQDRINCVIFEEDGTGHFLYSMTQPVPDVWYHVVFTHDNNTTRLYVNGLLEAEDTIAFVRKDEMTRLRIGKHWDGGAIRLDEVQIYNQALNGDAVELLHGQQGSLLGYFGFDALTLVDGSGNGNDFISAEYPVLKDGAESMIDHCVAFDGIEDYYEGAAAALDPTNAFTLTLWAKLDTLSSEAGMLANGTNWDWMLRYFNTTEGINFMLKDSGGVSHHIYSGVVPEVGTWHQIAVTYDGSVGTLYVDGVSVGSAILPGGLLDSGDRLFVGRHWSFSGTSYSMDELYIYGKAFSSELIARQYGQQSYFFDQTISDAVLRNYLSHAVKHHGLIDGGTDWFNDDMRMLENIGVRFAGRTALIWAYPDDPDFMADYIGNMNTFADKAHGAIPELMLQACIFETIDIDVETYGPDIPDWVFEAFGDTPPPTPRKFDYDSIRFADGSWRDQWGPGVSVPDITRQEAKYWFYYLGRIYIDCGVESLHFGQMELIGRDDGTRDHLNMVQEKLRDHARSHARRGMVLFDAHVDWTVANSASRWSNGGKLVWNFSSFPTRPADLCDYYLEYELIPDYESVPYGYLPTGATHNGYTGNLMCLLEVDNGPRLETLGECSRNGSWIWGYDENGWFIIQEEVKRDVFYSYARKTVNERDPECYFLPNTRIHMQGAISPILSGIYHANDSDWCQQGHDQETTLKDLFATGVSAKDYFAFNRGIEKWFQTASGVPGAEVEVCDAATTNDAARWRVEYAGDGHYWIVNESSGCPLRFTDSAINSRASVGNPSDRDDWTKWQLKYHDAVKGSFLLINKQTGNWLRPASAADGSKLLQADSSGAIDSGVLWSFPNAAKPVPRVSSTDPTSAYWRFEETHHPSFLADSGPNQVRLYRMGTDDARAQEAPIPATGSASAYFNPVPRTGTANTGYGDTPVGTYFQANDHPAFDWSGSDFTVETVYTAMGGWQSLVSQVDGGGSYAFRLIADGGVLRFQGSVDGNVDPGTLLTATWWAGGFAVDKDYYAAAVIEPGALNGGDDARVTFYFKNLTDGLPLQSGEMAIPGLSSIHNGTAPLRVGNYNGQTRSVDEVRITKSALALDQLLITHMANYELWLEEYPGLTETNKTDNPDGDLLDNWHEYALGGNPAIPDMGYVPSFQWVEDGSGNYIEYLHVQRKGRTDLDYHLETTTDLIDDPWTNGFYDVVATNTGYDLEFDEVTNHVPTDVEPVQFIRLIVE